MARKVNHTERKREVALKALHLFSQVGYENVTLIMIAAATGVSRTVLYRYFDSKRDVMDAAIATVLDEIETASVRIVLERESALVKVERICHVVADVMFARREFVIAIFDFVLGMVRAGSDMSARIRAYTSGTRRVLIRLVEQVRRNGNLADTLLPDRVVDAIYAEFESCALRIALNAERDSAAAKVRLSNVVRAIAVWR